MHKCAELAFHQPAKLPETPKVGLQFETNHQDVQFLLQNELSTIKKRLDELVRSQASWQPVMLRIEQKQEKMQTCLTFVEKIVGMPKSHAQEIPQEVETTTRIEEPAIVIVNSSLPTPAVSANTMPAPCAPVGEISSHSGNNLFAERVAARRKHRLEKIFMVDEEERARLEKIKQTPLRARLLHDKDLEVEALDSFSIIAVLANTIFMGLRLDFDETGDDPYWFGLDITFTVVFALEWLLRLYLKGFKQFYTEHAFPRVFDATLVVMDVSQCVLSLSQIAEVGGSVSISLFRIIRFGRFVRVFRLLGASGLTDLVAMLQGIGDGATTLFWAMLLFVLTVYIAALLCREAFGRASAHDISEYFNSVPRSMLTMFRCSFGDCSTRVGTPIFEHVNNSYAYGGVASLFYCFFLFSVSIGLFNVISAIYVDGAMSAAAAGERHRKQERLDNETLMSTNVSVFVKRVLQLAGLSVQGKYSEEVNTMADIEIDRSYVDTAVRYPDVRKALDQLDIDPHDQSRLSDILDPDHGGTVTVFDLMVGIQELRGQPRRSDIIRICLMVRALQDRFEDVAVHVNTIKRHTHPGYMSSWFR